MPRRGSRLDRHMTSTFEHWRQRIDEQEICWLTFDKAGSSANTLSQAVLDELAAIVDGLSMGSVHGVVIESGKSNGFIAGADVKEFARVDSAGQIVRLTVGDCNATFFSWPGYRLYFRQYCTH